MIRSAAILPTGDEIVNGTVLDLDSPEIIRILLKDNPICTVSRLSPVLDVETVIRDRIADLAGNVELIVLIGGSGGGHRFCSSLGKDFTHTAMEEILEEKSVREIYGYNGHLWSRLICGRIGQTVVINVPGPFVEAQAAIEAFCDTFARKAYDLPAINKAMAEAVIAQYPIQTYNAYVIEDFSNTEHPFALAVLCDQMHRSNLERKLSGVGTLLPEAGSDPVAADTALAKLLETVCPPYIKAAAAVASFWTDGNVSGGVIGNPHSASASASAVLDEIAPSLWQWAYPGRCGFVVNADRNTAERLIDIAYDGIRQDWDPWPELREVLVSNPGVHAFLYACDASGQPGRLCAGAEGDFREIEVSGKKERIGILGGTFDPVHYGHLQLAARAADLLKLDKVLFLITGTPEYKHPEADADHRREMVRLAIGTDSRFELCETEGGAYTADDFRKIVRNYPDAKLFYLMGSDSAAGFSQWVRSGEIAQTADVCSFSRTNSPGDPIGKILGNCPSPGVRSFETDLPEISSTEIRRRLRSGEDPGGLLPEDVILYIQKNGLYGAL